MLQRNMLPPSCGVTELVQMDAEFSYCTVGGSMLQFFSHHLTISCCENLEKLIIRHFI